MPVSSLFSLASVPIAVATFLFLLALHRAFVHERTTLPTSPEQTRQIRINLEGACNMTHAALRHMNAGARVVTMASSTAVCGVPNQAVYSASKAGVYSLTEALNMELSLRNISVADVSVSVAVTPMIAKPPNKDSPAVQHPEFFPDKACVANTVWQAVHKASLYRVVGYKAKAAASYCPNADMMRHVRNYTTCTSRTSTLVLKNTIAQGIPVLRLTTIILDWVLQNTHPPCQSWKRFTPDWKQLEF
jgi:NAD(P)-dependent dehydrogenase (short-subunit alcohol dehydrogenase family)